MMTYRINESYRLKKMAAIVSASSRVVDLGYAQQPNCYLRNTCVVGVDVARGPRPKNYTATFQGTLEEYCKSTQAVRPDAILAGELIEHLEDPLSFLRNIHDALPKGGELVLSTPNPNSLIERFLTLTLSRRFYYTEEHLFSFPQRWLIRILEYAGFGYPVLYSGGFPIPFVGLVPFPRPWCYQTIVRCAIP